LAGGGEEAIRLGFGVCRQAGRLPVGSVRVGVLVVVGEREREQGRRKIKDRKA
jgi:hypothetical protein